MHRVIHELPHADAFLGFGTFPHHLGVIANEALHLPAGVVVQHEVGVLRLPGTQNQPLGFEAFHPANPAILPSPWIRLQEWNVWVRRLRGVYRPGVGEGLEPSMAGGGPGNGAAG